MQRHKGSKQSKAGDCAAEIMGAAQKSILCVAQGYIIVHISPLWWAKISKNE